jgi:hypothetical protein
VALAEARDLKNVRRAPTDLQVGEASPPDAIALVRSFPCRLTRKALNATARKVEFLPTL